MCLLMKAGLGCGGGGGEGEKMKREKWEFINAVWSGGRWGERGQLAKGSRGYKGGT